MISWNRAKLIKIGFALSLILAGSGFAQNVTVNPASAKQLIRGFGGIHIGSWNGGDLTAAQRLTAFGNDDGQIGMSIFRVFVDPDKNNWKDAVPTAKFAQEHGATLFASPWNPPTEMRENFGSQGQWRLKTSSYGAYRDHLNAFVAYMKSQGINLYAISIQNEPDYGKKEWCSWTAQEVLTFMKDYAGTITGAKVMAPESFQYIKSMSDPILNDPTALANMDILGAHLYGTPVDKYPYPLFKQKGAGKELWMTEVYTESNNDADLWPMALDVGTMIHNSMVEAEFQVFTWWTIRRKYSPIKEDGNISKRGYCFAQFSKFVRPGFTRIDATKEPVSGIKVSAYTKDNDMVIVVVNTNTSAKTVNFSGVGATKTSFTKYTTSGSKNLKNDGAVAASNGSFSTSFDAQSVTTLVFKGAAGTSSAAVSSSTIVSSSSAIPVSRAAYSAATIPGKVQTENYDLGGEGVAYHDNDATNSGNMYRTDGVDITGDATDGYKIGWTIAEEWLEYTVNVAAAGEYNWSARVASGADASAFHLLLDGKDISGNITVPKGTNWETFTTITGKTTALTAGSHILRLVIDTSYCNVDWIEFTTSGTTAMKFRIDDIDVATEFQVYNSMGSYLGNIKLNPGEDARSQMNKLTTKHGIYILKSLRSGRSFQLER